MDGSAQRLQEGTEEWLRDVSMKHPATHLATRLATPLATHHSHAAKALDFKLISSTAPDGSSDLMVIKRWTIRWQLIVRPRRGARDRSENATGWRGHALCDASHD